MPRVLAARTAPAAALVALLLAGCAREPSPAPVAAPKVRNLVVILVDTLRADHLSLYGYERPTSPNLDRLAGRSGIVFENARSQSNCTFPSVNSLLTSRAPTVFLAGLRETGFAIPEATPSIARRLADAGYATAAVSASPIVRATPSPENEAGGFGDGFDSFDEECRWREAACVMARARPALDELPEPFFVYLHFLEPHDPYRPQPFPGGGHPFAGDGPEGPDKEWVRLGDPRPVANHLYSGEPDPGLTDADLEHLVALYDEEILYWDEQMLEIFARLERRGMLESTAIAIVSDHGEEFLEHGHVKHCRTLYDTEIGVPMVLFVPGRGPLRVTAPVSNLDLVPTLLDLVGVEAPDGALEGRSLRPLFEGGTLPRAPQFAAYGQLRAVVDGGWKLVRNLRARETELYDLGSDPGETGDRATAAPDEVRRLRLLLGEWRRSTEPEGARQGADEAEKQLRAVGYLD